MSPIKRLLKMYVIAYVLLRFHVTALSINNKELVFNYWISNDFNSVYR